MRDRAVFRNRIKQLVNSSQRGKKLYNKRVNDYVSGSCLVDADNLNFKKNTIDIPDNNSSLSLGNNSFTKSCVFRFSGNNNHVLIADNSAIYGSQENAFHIIGDNNTIVIGPNTIIRNTSFFISGSSNTITVGDHCSFMLGQFHVEGDKNGISLGDGVTIHGRGNGAVHMAVDEGSRIVIGDDCMLSNDIQIRSTDSHSILDASGKRINPAKDVVIGKHCWIGMRATVLKGAVLSPNTVVAAGSVVTKAFDVGNCVLAGNPAAVVNEGINWDRKYL